MLALGAMTMDSTIGAAARGVLATAEARAKAEAARALAAAWREGLLPAGAAEAVPDRPARPALPRLGLPREVPKRKVTAALPGRVALLHALAHIELNAVDLAADLLARFAPPSEPAARDAWTGDWLRVLDEEGKHFLLLQDRLAGLGAAYGDLVAHDGLWQAAEETAGDLLARLAVVPLVLEARGLDVTPPMVRQFEAAGDAATAAVLRRIYEDEKGHVFVGASWFRYLCDREGEAPEPRFHALVRKHFRAALKPPFNDRARSSACLTPGFYRPLETVRT